MGLGLSNVLDLCIIGPGIWKECQLVYVVMQEDWLLAWFCGAAGEMCNHAITVQMYRNRYNVVMYCKLVVVAMDC